MAARAKPLRAPEISLHFDDPPTESSNILPHSQPKHGFVSLTDTFLCSLALNRITPDFASFQVHPSKYAANSAKIGLN